MSGGESTSPTTVIAALVVLVVAFPLVLLVAQVLFTALFSYRVERGTFRFLLLHLFSVKTVPLCDVLEARTVSMAEVLFPRSRAMFNAIRASNRVYVRRAVVIERRAGTGRSVVITPADPEAFCNQLNASAAAARP